MTIQTEIAQFASSFRAADLTPELTRVARRCITDTLAAMIVGPSSELADALLDYVNTFPSAGPVPILGTALTASAERAALANGTFGHALDFDDTVSMMPGHPGAVMVSALLSASGGRGVTGEAFLTALVVGYEVAIKVGRAIGMDHYNRGWHATGSIGGFGATAAVANLMGLSEQATVNALGIAASTASGLRANFGTMTKPLHSGWAATSGLTAAQLASTGFTAAPNAMDAFFDSHGSEASDPSALHLGQPFAMLEPGIAHKRYPCCYAMHRAIEGLEGLRADGILGGPTPVVRLEAHIPPGGMRPLPYHQPKTGFEGKFSMEYALAIGLIDGRFILESFTDEAVNRPEVREALTIISAAEDPEVSPGDPDGRKMSAGTRGFVRVVATLADGRVASKDVVIPPGSPQAPLSDADLVAKFRHCANFAGLSPASTDQALVAIEGFAELADVSTIFDVLAGATSGQPVGADR